MAEFPLCLRKCEDLANHYLGFNEWNTEILYHRLETLEPEEDLQKATYCTAVR